MQICTNSISNVVHKINDLRTGMLKKTLLIIIILFNKKLTQSSICFGWFNQLTTIIVVVVNINPLFV